MWGDAARLWASGQPGGQLARPVRRFGTRGPLHDFVGALDLMSRDRGHLDGWAMARLAMRALVAPVHMQAEYAYDLETSQWQRHGMPCTRRRRCGECGATSAPS